jgi:beta-lactamase regulating signal transducer with metallopeptidase domain
MSGLQLPLQLCMIQVTLLSAAALVLCLAVHRRSPTVRTAAALSAFGGIAIVSVLAFTPWPNWSRSLWQASAAAMHSSIGNNPHPGVTVNRGAEPENIAVQHESSESLLATLWSGFRDGLTTPPQEAAVQSFSLWTIVPLLFLAGLCIGTIRLVGGWWAVVRLQQGSRLLHDQSLSEELKNLATALECRLPIELRETSKLSTAATLGWRRPSILLPANWTLWSTEERTAVLAHEIAHIHHRDYPAWMLAQISLLLHFYHPLVHWLARRLRLDQELAADAVAAVLAGGRQAYLQTLARLALGHADGPLNWPVTAFVPTHRTFLRRIEMLRDPRQFNAQRTGAVRWLIPAVVVLSALGVAGLRGPVAEQVANAAAETQDAKAAIAPSSSIQLSFVPRDAVFVVGFRPSDSLATKSMLPVAQMLRNSPDLTRDLGVDLDAFQQVLVVGLKEGGGAAPISIGAPAFVLQTKTADQLTALLGKLGGRQTETFETFTVSSGGAAPGACAKINETTLIYSPQLGTLRRLLIVGQASTGTADMASAWKRAGAGDIVLAVNVGQIPAPTVPTPEAKVFAFLGTALSDVKTVAVSLNVGTQAEIHGHIQNVDAPAAQRTLKTLEALFTLARNGLSSVREQAGRLPSVESAQALKMADMASDILEKLKTDVVENVVTFQVIADAEFTAKLTSSLLPAVQSARAAAQRTQDFNKIRNIALAFHNYHDRTGRFPPASVTGPDGKTLHSWRVEILPDLGVSQDIIDAYRKDEPWDSENNRKLLAKIPDVYRSAADPADSTNSSFFLLSGNRTAVAGKGKLTEITDGTSNTLLVVEARREIPWTKPEDIPFDPSQPVPELGGHHPSGFIAAFCDGSARFLAQGIAAATLRNLIMRDDGNPIDHLQFAPNRN